MMSRHPKLFYCGLRAAPFCSLPPTPSASRSCPLGRHQTIDSVHPTPSSTPHYLSQKFLWCIICTRSALVLLLYIWHRVHSNFVIPPCDPCFSSVHFPGHRVFTKNCFSLHVYHGMCLLLLFYGSTHAIQTQWRAKVEKHTLPSEDG